MSETNSTSGAFVLPQYKWDLSHSAKAQNFQREMADRKDNADRLEQEAKNWQIPYDKIDKLYYEPVKQAAAKLSANITDKIRRDPKYVNTPEYQNEIGQFKSVLGEAIQGSANIQAQDKMRFDHPEKLAVTNPAAVDARTKGDYNAFKEANGGNGLYGLETGYGPNFDVEKATTEMIKAATLKGESRTEVMRNGKKQWQYTPNMSDEAAAGFISNLEHYNPVFAHLDPSVKQGMLQRYQAAKQGRYEEWKPEKDGSINLNMGIGGGANGKWSWNRDETPVPITTVTNKVVANSSVIEHAKNEKSLERLQTAFKGIATPEEVAYLKEYANASTEDRIKLAAAKGVPTLSTKKYDVELDSDVRYNLQNIGATENKVHSWKTYNGSARDTKTGLPIKGTVVDGELLDVIHTPGSKMFPEGWYTLIADANNKVVAIPYEKSATEIKTYTVDKYGKNGFDLSGVISKGMSAPVQKASTAPKQTTAAKVSTQSEYDALPKGSQYIGPDGQLRTKN
jgi:hypothetical protein